MLDLPGDVLTSGVLVHLSIRDLQAVNVAFTSTLTQRARIKELWKSFSYECIDGRAASLNELMWLRSVEVRVFSIISSDEEGTVEVLQFVQQNFPLLRKLNVMYKMNFIYKDGCDDNLLAKLASGCPLLEELSASLWWVSDMGILALVQKCSKLHTLNIHNGVDITNDAVYLICELCPHLRHIGFSECGTVTDTSLSAIANTYPNIQSISLLECDMLTENGLRFIAEHCQALRSIAICNCYMFSGQSLTALLASNPNLVDIEISYSDFVSDYYIIQLVQCCPLLQKLNISLCEIITDAAVIAVAEHCLQLKSLDISQCDLVTDASLIALGQHCHELMSINISLLRNISDVGIAALAAGCSLLQEFNAKLTVVTDAGVVALARGCRDLRVICLQFCHLIGITAVRAIAENCLLISDLSLCCCNINDACIYAIAKHCHNIIHLDVDDHKASNAVKRILTYRFQGHSARYVLNRVAELGNNAVDT